MIEKGKKMGTHSGLANHSFTNWDELEAQLSMDFEGHDYGDSLLDYIKSHLQKPGERVLNYFADIEDLFLKLNIPVKEFVKINIIQKNLRPEFVRGLGINKYNSSMKKKKPPPSPK